MRTRSLARFVIASLGLIFTVGCIEPTNAPTPFPKGPNAHLLSYASISPNAGPSIGGNVVTIRGTEFDAATTVTLDGSRVVATVLNAKTISLVMPAHAAGKVDVSVIRAPGQAPIRVNGGHGYSFRGAPVIRKPPCGAFAPM